MNRFIFAIIWLLPPCAHTAAPMTADPFAPSKFVLPHKHSTPIANCGELNPLNDTIRPVITCPPSVTLTLLATKCDTAYLYDVSATDNIPGVAISQNSGLASGAKFKSGTTVNAFVATDLAGNTATCSFSVKVNNGSFGLLCKNNVAVSLEANCATVLSLSNLLETKDYGCPNNYIIEIDRLVPFGNGPWFPPELIADDLGKNYSYRITDLVTGFKCANPFLVRDQRPPSLQCPDVAVPCGTLDLSPGFLKDSLDLLDAQVRGTDNCGGNVSISFQDQIEQVATCDTLQESLVLRTWSATDERNNTGKCVQRVYRKKFNIAAVRFPANIALPCGAADLSPEKTGFPFVEEAGRRFSIKNTTFCDFNAIYKDTVTPVCGVSKLIRRHWEVTEGCSNAKKKFIQFIEIQDKTGPALQCPSDPIVKTKATPNCLSPVTLPNAVITDQCSPVVSLKVFWESKGQPDSLQAKLSNFAGSNPAIYDTLALVGTDSLFPIGVTLLRYVAADACGNTNSCTVNISVWDDVPPVAKCNHKPSVHLGSGGTITLNAKQLDNGSSDNCTTNLFFQARRVTPGRCKSNIFFKPDITFCCEDINDSIAVILRVFDIVPPPSTAPPDFANGHFKDCLMYVQVRDTASPKCTAPPDLTVNCRDFDRSLASYGSVASASCKVLSVFESVDYSQFDTSCISGTLLRMFKTRRANGQFGGSCSHKITVVYEDPGFFVRFPNDVAVTSCTPNNLYGEPQFNGLDCENMSVTFTDSRISPVQNGCYLLERTWRVVNKCYFDSKKPLVEVPNPNPHPVAWHADNLLGPTVSSPSETGTWKASVTPLVFSQTPLNFSTLWSEKTAGYTYVQLIRVSDNVIPEAQECGSNNLLMGDASPNDPDMWGLNFWWDPVNLTYDLTEGEVSLSISGTDDCLGENVKINYLLYLDLDGVGGQETVVSSANLPNNNIIHYNNLNTPNFSGGTPRLFDNRGVPTNLRYGFTMQTTQSGRFKKAKVMWNTQLYPDKYVLPQIPYGNHRVRWILEDDCGNRKECENNFTVKRSALPILNCDTTFQVEITPSCYGILDFDDVLPPILNYKAPNSAVTYRFKKTDGKSVFPIQNDTILYYNGKEKGERYAEFWAKDTANVTTFCTFKVNVVDPTGGCDTIVTYKLSGRAQSAKQEDLEEVSVTLHSPAYAQAQTLMAKPNGTFELPNVPAGYAYEVIPSKNNAPLNGVSTYDLVLISKHILGLEALDSPYKMIAADANKSNSITTLDIVELRKLILGIYLDLPKAESWRFVDKSYTFPNPQNPFETRFPESIAASAIVADNPFCNFIGIKTGDINQNAAPNAFSAIEDRGKPKSWFETKEKDLRSGDIFDLEVWPDSGLAAYQFTLQHPDLQAIDLKNSAGIKAENLGVFEGVSTVAVERAVHAPIILTMKALRDGFLSEMLSMNSRITPAEAYTAEGIVHDLDLKIRAANARDASVAKPGLRAQAVPNPIGQHTEIRFVLAEPAQVKLTLSDQNGRILYVQSGLCAKGPQGVVLNRHLFGAPGIYHYRLQTEREHTAGIIAVE